MYISLSSPCRLPINIQVTHFIVSLWLFAKSFAYAFSAFDTSRELTLIERINYFLVEILFFPIVTIFEATNYEGTSTIAQYFPFILNSMLWGIFIVIVWNVISRIYK